MKRCGAALVGIAALFLIGAAPASATTTPDGEEFDGWCEYEYPEADEAYCVSNAPDEDGDYLYLYYYWDEDAQAWINYDYGYGTEP